MSRNVLLAKKRKRNEELDDAHVIGSYATAEEYSGNHIETSFSPENRFGIVEDSEAPLDVSTHGSDNAVVEAAMDVRIRQKQILDPKNDDEQLVDENYCVGKDKEQNPAVDITINYCNKYCHSAAEVTELLQLIKRLAEPDMSKHTHFLPTSARGLFWKAKLTDASHAQEGQQEKTIHKHKILEVCFWKVLTAVYVDFFDCFVASNKTWRTP